MTAETSPATPNAPDPIEQGADYLLGLMAQGNPANVVAAVHQLTSQYDARVMTLMLDSAGKKIGQAQAVWGRAAQNWHIALQQTGRNAQFLSAQVHQILQENAAGDESSQTSA